MASEMMVTFGEVMGRLVPPDHLRLRQVMPGSLDFTFGGAEANIAVSLSRMGMKSRFVTALPANPISEACIDDLRGHGVDTSGIVIGGSGRFGLYFVERGANQRPSRVTYDREGSTVCLTPPDAYDWNALFSDARWFHVTGITPAISSLAADAALVAVQVAKERGLTVSMDLNFRGKLWKWEAGTKPKVLAGRVMRRFLPFVDILIGNEGDAEDILGIKAGESDVETGALDIERYPAVAKKIAADFPNLRKIAITLRESISADCNKWGAMLFDTASGETAFAPLTGGVYSPWQIADIVDRVGGGDAFGAGLIRALAGDEFTTDADAIAFAVAAGCLAHSITGDYNLVSFDEVVTLMGGSGSGRVVR